MLRWFQRRLIVCLVFGDVYSLLNNKHQKNHRTKIWEKQTSWLQNGTLWRSNMAIHGNGELHDRPIYIYMIFLLDMQILHCHSYLPKGRSEQQGVQSVVFSWYCFENLWIIQIHFFNSRWDLRIVLNWAGFHLKPEAHLGRIRPM